MDHTPGDTGKHQPGEAASLGRRGQAMVLAAVALAVMLAFAALLVNAGFLLVERRHLQNTADAAALAATWAVLAEQASGSLRDAAVSAALTRFIAANDLTGDVSYQLMGEYLDSDGVPVGTVGGGILPDGSSRVRVTLTRSIAAFLPKMLRITAWQATAAAVAGIEPTGFQATFVNPLPLAVPLAAFQAGADNDLYDGSVALSSYGVAGYVPFLDLTAASNTGGSYMAATSYGDLHLNLQYWSDGGHNSGILGIGSQVALAGPGYEADVETGLHDNVRRQGLMDAYGNAYALVTVPLWDRYIAASNSVRIAGFAVFRLMEADISQYSLSGSFVPSVFDPSRTDRTTGPDWGPAVVALVQ